MDKRIESLLNYLEANLDKSLSLEDLAAQVFLSESQFHRLFKKNVGKTAFKFIEKLKMAAAYQLLLETDLKVLELAERFAYKDYETFSRAFKKHYKLSPDDLKLIVLSVMKAGKINNSEEVILATFNSEDITEADLQEKLKTLAADNNVSDEDLKESKIFRISQIEKAKDKESLIKNKYELKADKKLWKSLIEKEEKND